MQISSSTIYTACKICPLFFFSNQKALSISFTKINNALISMDSDMCFFLKILAIFDFFLDASMKMGKIEG